MWTSLSYWNLDIHSNMDEHRNDKQEEKHLILMTHKLF